MGHTIRFEGKTLQTKAEIFEARKVMTDRHIAVTERLEALVSAGKCMPGALLVYSWTENHGLMAFSEEFSGYYLHSKAQKATMLQLGVCLQMGIEAYEKALRFVEEQEAATDETCQRAQVCIKKGREAGMTAEQAKTYAQYDINHYRTHKDNGVAPEQYLAREQEQVVAGSTCLPISPGGLKNKVHAIMRKAGIRHLDEPFSRQYGTGYFITTDTIDKHEEPWTYIELRAYLHKRDLEGIKRRVEQALRDAHFWDAYVVEWSVSAVTGNPMLQFAIYPEYVRSIRAKLEVSKSNKGGDDLPTIPVSP